MDLLCVAKSFRVCFFTGCTGSKHERALLKKLFQSGYDLNERPVLNDSDAVVVTFGLTLNQIVDVVRIFNSVIFLTHSCPLACQHAPRWGK